MRLFKFSAALLVALSLAACSGVGSSTLSSITESEVTLKSGTTVGQTFVAENAGLDGLLVYLDPEGDLSGEVRLRLRSDSQAKTDISQSVISADQITQANTYRFEFSPQSDSFRKYYYAFLEYEGSGTIRVGNAQAESYLEGALYVDHRPLDLQMSFQLTYQPALGALGFLRELLYWLVILLVAIFLFIIPGRAILIGLWPASRELDFISTVGISAGISLALYPLLFLWTDTFGLHLGRAYAWFPATGGLLYLLWKTKPRDALRQFRGELIAFSRSDGFWSGLALLLTVGAVIFVRFFMIRGIDAPMWGDSVQHTMIAQLLVNNGGLFDSWAPLAELESLTYHFGFHSHVAVFHWITGLDLPSATLWTGQILNILAVVSLYALVRKAGGNRWGGISAIFIAGLLTPMPNFYTNWGRYTQLAGQVILPTAALMIWQIYDLKKIPRGLIVLTSITMAGLGLTHYRVLIFALLFVLTLFLLSLLKKNYANFLPNIFRAGIGGIILFLPWVVTIVESKIFQNLLDQLSTSPAEVSKWIRTYNAMGDLTTYLPATLWIISILSLIVGIVQRRWATITLGIWWAFVLLAANPNWINLPGEGALSNFAVLIALYIPSSLIIGSVFNLPRKARPSVNAIFITIFLVLTLVGFRERLSDLDAPSQALVTRPDIRAYRWIRENIPLSGKFLTNAFFAYNDTVIVGSDGGWWLPLMTNRQSSLPPINYGVEKGPRPDYVQWQNELVAQLQNEGVNGSLTRKMLMDRGITYLYIGQRQGSVNSSGSIYLDPDQLNKSSFYQSIYNQDRVWIFEVLP